MDLREISAFSRRCVHHALGAWILLLSIGLGSVNADTAPEIAKKAFRSTLIVIIEDKKGRPLAFGSGFFVGEGQIATNYHVVKGAVRVKAKLVNTETEFIMSEVVGFDKERDLAILKVSGPRTPFLPIGDSNAAEVGETVYAVGSPQGLEGTFSQGIISGRRLADKINLLQITAPISPGSSGGPVMNENGQVIGIATAYLTNGQNLNLAVPSNELRALLAEIADKQKARPVRAVSSPLVGRYPWRLHITTTLFWIGDQPSGTNQVAHFKSPWDPYWMKSYGGYDDPDVSNRIANHATGEFRPKAFVPNMNSFYVALPYNDVISSRTHKPEATLVIPWSWFARLQPKPGESVCKGRWVEIYNGQRSCFAQWEDCGPWVTDDWEYVFGSKPPKNKENGGTGLSMSPAIRDYLGLASGKKVHWRFVEAKEVPNGPWKKYGPKQPTLQAPGKPDQPQPANTDQETRRRYLEILRSMRVEEYLRRPLSGPTP